VETLINVDGKITAPEQACVPVLDHGFLFGDSVYEVLWWHHGALIQEKEHLDRLEASAGRLYMELQFSRAELVATIDATLEAAGASATDDAYVRLIVTRGTGPLGLAFTQVPQRSLIIVVAPAQRPAPEVFERGLHMALVDRLRMSMKALDPRAKTGNYLNNVLALHEARLAGADDAIMLNDDGDVTEATTANVYAVRAGRVTTPPLDAGILEGTTRMRILGLCRDLGVDVEEATLRPEELLAAAEIFVSSSVRGILPVTRIDETPIGDGAPGPLTRQLRTAFEAAAAADSAAKRA
jgi:branched-chain amino acid aminotransferase